jgi:hypothetical protein
VRAPALQPQDEHGEQGIDLWNVSDIYEDGTPIYAPPIPLTPAGAPADDADPAAAAAAAAAEAAADAADAAEDEEDAAAVAAIDGLARDLLLTVGAAAAAVKAARSAVPLDPEALAEAEKNLLFVRFELRQKNLALAREIAVRYAEPLEALSLARSLGRGGLWRFDTQAIFDYVKLKLARAGACNDVKPNFIFHMPDTDSRARTPPHADAPGDQVELAGRPSPDARLRACDWARPESVGGRSRAARTRYAPPSAVLPAKFQLEVEMSIQVSPST